MAVAQTGAIFKTLEFDGENSGNYGVYISGEAVYNAPERDVEMISIPGRNGAFALDNGRFENIEVTYPAGIFADNETDFAQAISDFRNFLCSKRGYCRLTDDYNPDEYRMAIYKSGLEVTPAQLKAGEFEITFECKPQRFLTSGETAVTVTSGNTITNPTLFDTQPMLEVTGNGNIQINNDNIYIQNIPLGEIQLSERIGAKEVTLKTANLNNGDLIYDLEKNRPYISLFMNVLDGTKDLAVTINSVTNGQASFSQNSSRTGIISVYPSFNNFVMGTSATLHTIVSLDITVGTTLYQHAEIDVQLSYNGSNSIELRAPKGDFPSATILRTETNYYHPAYYGDSTQTALPSPLYIDLDIGEAYGVLNNEPLSFNNIVSLPAELPTLKSGSNTITYDNTITDLKIVPRWWKI